MLIQVPAQHDLPVYQQKRNKHQSLCVGLAQTEQEIEEAQRLRRNVFTEEYGAKFLDQASDIDEDHFDKWCDHLLVRDLGTNRVIGTYRVLRPEQALLAGGYYSESEFNLTGLNKIRHQIVEFGRACIDAEYRNGPTLMMLWSGLANLVKMKKYQYVLGCASVSLRDDGVTAATVWRTVRSMIDQDRDLNVIPHCPYPAAQVNTELPAQIPALIEAYLKLGVKVCGEPAWDPDFNTVDFPMLLTVSQMNLRYKKRLGFDHEN